MNKTVCKPTTEGVSRLADLRGGVVTFLSSVYIILLIPTLLGDGITTAASTAIACAVGSLLFAMATGMPFAVGPGVVPASIVAGMLARGVPFETVLGVEMLAGLAFLALASGGAIRLLVRQMPTDLKSAGQIAIGIYLLMAALRAVGQAHVGASEGMHWSAPGWIYLIGLALVFVLSQFKRLGAYAILAGTLFASLLAWSLGFTHQPTQALAMPHIRFFIPDAAAALHPSLLVDALVLLYVVLVDVASTLETLAKCTPELCDESGSLKNLDRNILLSGVIFIISPFLGSVPLLVFFESMAGTLSGARTARAGYLVAGAFAAMVFLAPLASLFPVYACVIGLTYIGYCIVKHAVMDIRVDGRSNAHQTRYLIGMAVVAMLVTQSLSMTLSFLFTVYALRFGKTRAVLSKWVIGATLLAIGLMVSRLS